MKKRIDDFICQLLLTIVLDCVNELNSKGTVTLYFRMRIHTMSGLIGESFVDWISLLRDAIPIAYEQCVI